MTKLSGRSLLLLELSILLAFFLFAAVTCTYMFVKASGQAQDAEAINKAVVKTTSIAETLKSSKGDLDKTGSLLGNKASYTIKDDQLLLYLDETMAPATQSSAVYVAKIQKKKSGIANAYQVLIKRNEDNAALYSLDFKGLRKGGGEQ